MRFTRARVAVIGTATVLALAIPLGINLTNDEAPTAAPAQTPAASTASSLPASDQETQPETDAQRIAYIKAHYGVHFDHPANKDVTEAAALLPYTNVWADIQFRGQDDGGTYLPPTIKTYGDVKVSIPAKPRKESSPSSDDPGATRTIFLWDMTVTFGGNVTYYMTMYNSNRTDDPNITDTFNGWSAFVGDNAGKQPKGKKSVDVVAAELAERVIITGTDPAKSRDGAMDGLPVTWRDLATEDQHLPTVNYLDK